MFRSSISSNVSAAHEIGHMLLNWAEGDVVERIDPLTNQRTYSHYVGSDELYNLMKADIRSVDPGSVKDSKRLWNDSHHYDGYHARQIDYL